MADEIINNNTQDNNDKDRKKGLIIKIIIAVIALAVVIGGVFFACSKAGKGDNDGLDDDGDTYGFETEVVTDENGEAVTDENGQEVTTEVAVKYEKDKKGKKVAYKIDENGNYVTNANGDKVTVPVNDNTTKFNGETANTGNTVTTGKFTTGEPDDTTGTTKKNAESTKNGTTAFSGDDIVPETGDSGTEVNFSADDTAVIENMLEVPYLYLSSYENSDGVPINIAAHTAVWMASRDTGDIEDGSGSKTFPAGPVVLNLFKYYGQTVIYFKAQCNTYATGANAPISYSRENDTFTITGYTAKTHNVTINSIEDLGNNNYYKVTGTVKEANDSGCKKKKVVAILQKNKLDPSLGFSVKALKWS